MEVQVLVNIYTISPQTDKPKQSRDGLEGTIEKGGISAVGHI